MKKERKKKTLFYCRGENVSREGTLTVTPAFYWLGMALFMVELGLSILCDVSNLNSYEIVSANKLFI